MKTIPADLLGEIVRRLATGLQPVRIFLFGSHAYGNPVDDSDIDLLIEVPDSKEPRHRRAAVAYGLLQGLAAPTELFVLTSAELERAAMSPLSLEHIVKEKGRLLYG